MERTTTAYQLALAQDQLTTLFPDPPTRFSSYEDMVRRLVPYHIWQTHDEELEGYEGESPGKRTAREARGEFVICHRTRTIARTVNLYVC